MSRLAWHCTCPDCGGPLRSVNQAPALACRAVAIVACEDCEAEWSVRVDMFRMSSERRSKAAVDKLAEAAHWLVYGGVNVRQACLEMGISRQSYEDRYVPQRARKAAVA